MAMFKAYDIRGVVPDELDREKAKDIAKAIATFKPEIPLTNFARCLT